MKNGGVKNFRDKTIPEVFTDSKKDLAWWHNSYDRFCRFELRTSRAQYKSMAGTFDDGLDGKLLRT